MGEHIDHPGLRRAPAEAVHRAIADELARMEAAEDLRVLVAVESGSRAWGFASDDSDFDVRFVYIRPLSRYLRLERTRDVVEWRLDDVLDISGWDADKALALLRGSNPSIIEWMASPIIYAEDARFSLMRNLARDCFSPVACAHHYLSMVAQLRTPPGAEEVVIKKCLYVMRALLAARWVITERRPAPMRFGELVDALLEPPVVQLAHDLMALKAAGDEHSRHPRIPALDAWVELTTAQLQAQAAALKAPAPVPWDRVDGVFLELLGVADERSRTGVVVP